jgi:pilus assembly protein CpaB
MNRRRVIGVGAAIVLAGLGTVGTVSWANSTRQSAEAAEAQTPVVIVDSHVAKGADAATIRSATHIGTVQEKALQPGALTTEDQIGNQSAVADLEPGDQLVAARLGASPTDLPAGTVEMSIKLDAERAVGGILNKGDLVDIYLSTDKQNDTTPPTTTLGFQNIKVTNVQTADTTTDEKGAVRASQYIVTLALTADQQKLVAAAEYGHIWLVLEPQS